MKSVALLPYLLSCNHLGDNIQHPAVFKRYFSILAVTLCVVYYILWSMVYGLRSTDGLRSTVYGLRSMVYGLRSAVSGLRSPISGLRSVILSEIVLASRCHHHQ
jgi:hypothetical protein